MRGGRGGYGDVLEWGKGRVGIEGESGEGRIWEKRGGGRREEDMATSE